MKLVLPTESSLLEAVRVLVPGTSNRTLRQMLDRGRVRLNGLPAKVASRRLVPGDLVEITPHAVPSPALHGIIIAFEDEALLLVEKPAGLLTVATEHERQRTAFAFLLRYLKAHNSKQRLFIVHRLDKFASGVLVFAKSQSIQAQLKNMFSRHDIQRKYWAIVEGRVNPEHGTIRSYLAENRAQRMHSTADPAAGKEAITHFRVLRRFPQLTSLEVTLETGRKNQIRVHLSEFGHPIVGDQAYGSRVNPLGRLGLHASLLGFNHPVHGARILHKTKIPPEFIRYLPVTG